MREIESLLDSVGMAPAQVSRCLVVGGMAAMPSIRSRLHELFGPERVSSRTTAPPSSPRAQRGSRTTRSRWSSPSGSSWRWRGVPGCRLLRAGTPMPIDGEVTGTVPPILHRPVRRHREVPDRRADRTSEQPQASDGEPQLGMVTIDVDKTAPPLAERLELDIEIDDDLILKVTASSLACTRTKTARLLRPGIRHRTSGKRQARTDQRRGQRPRHPNGRARGPRQRRRCEGPETSPGEVLYKHTKRAFARFATNGATDQQLLEHLYFQPCAVCGRCGVTPPAGVPRWPSPWQPLR